jgi:SAM-dependent methyltransferase
MAVDHSSIFIKVIKLCLNCIQSVKVGIGRLAGLIDFPVPPNSGMRKTSSSNVKHYYVSGIHCALPIATAALSEGIPLHTNVSVLDFGCGVGRQLLHLTRNFPEASYYACDVDESAVAYIEKAFPRVDAHVNSFFPPLKYADATFDLVYSVSIFSHLGIEDIPTWLEELGRVTKPGGICCLTIEGKSALPPLARLFNMPLDRLEAELAKTGYLYQEYEGLRKLTGKEQSVKVATPFVGIAGTYGNTVLSREHVMREWSKGPFEVVRIIEGIIDYRQDLVVLRRKASA